MVARLVWLFLFNRYNRRFERFFRSFLSRSSDQDQAVAPALHRPTTALKGDSVLFRCGSCAVAGRLVRLFANDRYYRPMARLYRLVGFCSCIVSPGCTGTRSGCTAAVLKTQ